MHVCECLYVVLNMWRKREKQRIFFLFQNFQGTNSSCQLAHYYFKSRKACEDTNVSALKDRVLITLVSLCSYFSCTSHGKKIWKLCSQNSQNLYFPLLFPLTFQVWTETEKVWCLYWKKNWFMFYVKFRTVWFLKSFKNKDRRHF